MHPQQSGMNQAKRKPQPPPPLQAITGQKRKFEQMQPAPHSNSGHTAGHYNHNNNNAHAHVNTHPPPYKMPRTVYQHPPYPMIQPQPPVPLRYPPQQLAHPRHPHAQHAQHPQHMRSGQQFPAPYYATPHAPNNLFYHGGRGRGIHVGGHPQQAPMRYPHPQPHPQQLYHNPHLAQQSLMHPSSVTHQNTSQLYHPPPPPRPPPPPILQQPDNNSKYRPKKAKAKNTGNKHKNKNKNTQRMIPIVDHRNVNHMYPMQEPPPPQPPQTMKQPKQLTKKESLLQQQQTQSSMEVNIRDYSNSLPPQLLLVIERHKNEIRHRMSSALNSEQFAKTGNGQIEIPAEIESPFLAIGKCYGYVFGESRNEKWCQINANVQLFYYNNSRTHTNIHNNNNNSNANQNHRGQNRNRNRNRNNHHNNNNNNRQLNNTTTQHTSSNQKKKEQIHVHMVHGRGDTKKLGILDKQSQNVFVLCLRDGNLKLSARIIKANLSALKKGMTGGSQFVHKLVITVEAKRECLPLLIQNIASAKQFKWKEKSTILRYFTGETMPYSVLTAYVQQHECISSDLLGLNGIQSLSQLEANFSAMFEKDITAEDLEGIDAYDEIVETQLLQHQRIGLEWMINHEKFEENTNEDLATLSGTGDGEHLPPFFQLHIDAITHEESYKNILTGERCLDLPEIGCGGILADDMGLGKTLQAISLIASNSGFDICAEGDGPTLIVSPLTVMGNWIEQLENHCKANSFSVLEYHGPKREKNLDVIQSMHIVITTYEIVALEYNGETDENREEWKQHYGCGLQYVEWHRIILDEAHRIRNRKNRAFKACKALVSKSRWALSGTPVQNRLDDLYSLFCFLKLQPVCSKDFWSRFITQPLKAQNPIGFQRLRQIMKAYCLRRTKSQKNADGKKILNLRDKTITTRSLVFNKREQEVYNRLLEIHRERFRAMRQTGGDQNILKNFSSVLSMLLRLRQCCAHPILVPKEALSMTSRNYNTGNNNNSSGGGGGSGSGSAGNTNDLRFGEDANEECSSCGQPPETATLTSCHHIYCSDCFLYELEKNDRGFFHCILCGEKLTNNSILEQREKSLTNESNANNEHKSGETGVLKKKKKKYVKWKLPTNVDIQPSSKMQAVIDEVMQYTISDELGLPDKAVVFSQWTSVLDILGHCLKQRNIKFERLDGSMKRSARDAAMESFKINADIPVFLMSLKAGNLGVNMTSANKVYMLDPWWNPSTEDQAIDRVYRLGQKRAVDVVHFVMKDSVEEKIVAIQQRKRKLIKSALGQSKDVSAQERKQEWLNDLKDLFGSR